MTNGTALSIDIFVVDDERVIGQTLGIILRQAGYGVSVFEDAVTALEHMHIPPRLLISDQHMPGITGCELASVISDEVPSTKLLLFSSSLCHGDTEWIALISKSRDARLLAKPLYPAHLLSCVQEMIGRPAAV